MKEAALGTKRKILDAAECLFAERGIAGTSLRAVIGKAGVNLAAVHYHFGSKDALVTAVVHRRMEPVNRDRLAMLTECEAEAGAAGPSLQQIVESFIRPSFRYCKDFEGGEMFMNLMGRLMAEPDYFFGKVAPELFRQVLQRYMASLCKVLPGVPPAEILWRMMFGVGAMAHALRMGSRITAFSDGICRELRVEEIIQRLVDFIVAGLRAPVSEVSK